MNLSYFENMDAYIPDGFELLELENFIWSNFLLSGIILFRYFATVGPFYLLVLKDFKTKKLKPQQIAFEIKYSVISTIFFSLSAYIMGVCWQQGYTKIYLKFEEYPIWYLPLSFILYSIVHEVYFYFTHVWMHKPYVFKRIHSIHHYSNPVTPWASFSFHPYECLVHAVFLPMMILMIPIHPLVILSYLLFMTLTAISNHLGRELIPFRRLRNHFISGNHHSLHHIKYNGNYGLYYCFMDRLFNTEISSMESP